MQPVTIEAKPPVRASDGGRRVTAAASGSASFAALLLDTGTGSREPAPAAPRPAGKSETQRPKGDPAAVETDAAETHASDASGDTEEEDDLPPAAPVLPQIAGIDVPQPGTVQPGLPTGVEAATAVAAALPSAQPAPTQVPPAGAAPGAVGLPLQAATQADPAADAAADGEIQVQPQVPAEPTAPAAETSLPTFEDMLASTVAAAGDRTAQPAAANARARQAQAGATQGGTQPGRIGEPAQIATGPAQTSQPQTQLAVEAAAQGSAPDTAQIQSGAATASDVTVSTSTRSETSGTVNPLSPAAGATTQTSEAAAPTAPRAPMPAPPVHDQLAVHIQRAVSQGTDRITIHLSPGELGRIDVRLDLVEAGRVTATVAVERPETLDLLQRDARGLERALQDAGLKPDAGGLSFTLRDDGRRDTDGRQPFGGDGRRTADTEGTRVEPAVAARTVYSNGALDIRV